MSRAAGATSLPADPPTTIVSTAVQLWRCTGAPLLLPVTGTSMLPLLRPGDQVVVIPRDHTYPIGAMIVFPQADQLVVHRVVRRIEQGRRLLTKGDHGPFDSPIAVTDIVGLVTAIERDGVRRKVDSWAWRIGGWLLAQTAARPTLQRRLLRLAARWWERAAHP